MGDRSQYFQDYRKARGAALVRLIAAHPVEWEKLLTEERERVQKERDRMTRRQMNNRITRATRATVAS